MGSTPTISVNGIEVAYHTPQGRFALEESADDNGPVVVVHYKVAWGNRWALVQALRPTCVADASESGFTRTPPYKLPAALKPDPSGPDLYCLNAGKFQYQGSGYDESGEHEGRYVVIPASFGCVPWMFEDGDPAGQNDPSGQAWTVTKIKPSVEIYQPSGGTYYLIPEGGGAGTPLDEASVGFARANVEISQTRKFLPYLGLADLTIPGDTEDATAAMSSLNNAAMDFADASFDTGHLLLAAAEWSEPYFDCIGNQVGDLTLTYLGRIAATWNQAQDRTGAWLDINSKSDGSGNPPFKLYEMSLLQR